MKINNLLIIGIFILIAGAVGVGADSSFSGVSGTSVYSNTGADFRTFYNSEQLATYFPIIDNPDTCKARQDILLLQIPPAGCQPSVVRSDLLAEQNVPVFCQISGLLVNPLIDVKRIRNIRFTGNYPAGVVGAGFHPAKAALQTQNQITGSPLINNLGYVVVVLKKNEQEKTLPDFISVNLSAQLEYESGNAFGLGRSSLLLRKVSDEEWKSEKNRQSFLKGQYFARVEDFGADSAIINLYNGDKIMANIKAERGKESREVYLPGSYCQAALKVVYDGMLAADNVARIDVDGEVFDVYSGSRFLDEGGGGCAIENIQIDQGVVSESQAKTSISGKTGSLTIRCEGKSITLSLKAKELIVGNIVKISDDDTISWVIKSITENKDKKINQALLCKSGSDCSGCNDKCEAIDKAKTCDAKICRNEVSISSLIPTDKSKLYEKSYASNVEDAFKQAIESYEKIANDYPAEKENDATGAYGQKALESGIKLARDFSKEMTEARLINRLLEIYPNIIGKSVYMNRLDEIYSKDGKQSVNSIEVASKVRVIRLVDLSAPSNKAYGEFRISGGSLFKASVGEDYKDSVVTAGKTTQGNIPNAGNVEVVRVNEIVDVDSARVTTTCKLVKVVNTQTISGEVKSWVLKVGTPVEVCPGDFLKLEKLEMNSYAKIRLVPIAKNTQSETNLNVTIGIEKRAIQLSPEKTMERMSNLNESIKKWEKISEKLGNVVSGMKAACFLTATTLTIKNFFSGLSGQASAREKVMRGPKGWTEKCQQEVSQAGGKATLSQCYNAHADEIRQDVDAYTEAIKETNSWVKDKEANCQIESKSLLGGSVVNKENCAKAMLEDIKDSNNGLSVNSYKENVMNYQEIRDYKMIKELEQRGLSSAGQEKVNEMKKSMDLKIKQRVEFNNNLNEAAQITQQGFASPTNMNGLVGYSSRPAYVQQIAKGSGAASLFSADKFTSTLVLPSGGSTSVAGATQTIMAGGTYAVELAKQGGIAGSEKYTIESVKRKCGASSGTGCSCAGCSGTGCTPAGGACWENVNTQDFTSVYQIGSISAAQRIDYNNRIETPEIKFFETEPYKGMPAIVPFDVDNGWYAATKQTLPSFGGIKAFEANGRPVSFWICNVGGNERVDFSSINDDTCEQFNVETGQTFKVFPGLSESETKLRVNQAIEALNEAANKYGSKKITINGRNIDVGGPMVSAPGMQCQDFMSPGECKVLFNVCDPVICPSSRCNLGGAYPVANVIQTGIVGGALLCLPNYKEVAIPVCLSGIKAGIDGLVSLMKSHYQCLQENLQNGKMTGICDEIYSIYLCEMLWRQFGPVANLLLPKLVEMAYGQNRNKGGGEYLTVMDAWDNAQKSVNFFTQEYAVNSMEAFRIRSVEEAGTTFCKAFIGMKGPSAFESLIEPDSPSQFHAWFSSTRYSDATLPATAQYKVFYHIFAGEDSGVGYQVYLKDPPQNSYYRSTPYLMVASGFITKGEFATETKDFTAPEGYKQLCVSINGKEECGFSQVSSSFAVNSIRDEFVQSELENKNIAGEQECVAGSLNFRGLLTNPNIQSGFEESAFPSVGAERGVVRICATDNPGKGTDPTRFVEVGVCDDSKIKCWLDKTSVDASLSSNIPANAGVKNSTMNALNEIQVQTGGMLGAEAGAAQIKSVSEMSGDKEEDFAKKVSEMDSLFKILLFNGQKAKLLLQKGELFEKKAKELAKGSLGGSGSSGGEGSTISASQLSEISSGVIYAEGNVIKYNPPIVADPSQYPMKIGDVINNVIVLNDEALARISDKNVFDCLMGGSVDASNDIKCAETDILRVSGEESSKKILEQLEKKVSFDFVETPLADVVAFLNNLMGIPIILPNEIVATDDRPVTLKVVDMPLKKALILAHSVGVEPGKNLKLYVVNDAILIYSDGVDLLISDYLGIGLSNKELNEIKDINLKKKLNGKITFDFVETPLADVVAFLNNLMGIPIILPNEIVATDDRPVTLKVADMPLKNALNWIARVSGVDWKVEKKQVNGVKIEEIVFVPLGSIPLGDSDLDLSASVATPTASGVSSGGASERGELTATSSQAGITACSVGMKLSEAYNPDKEIYIMINSISDAKNNMKVTNAKVDTTQEMKTKVYLKHGKVHFKDIIFDNHIGDVKDISPIKGIYFKTFDLGKLGKIKLDDRLWNGDLLKDCLVTYNIFSSSIPIYIKDKEEYSLLSRDEYNNFDLFNFVLGGKMDINTLLEEGNTPLHLAIYGANKEVVKQLLDNKKVDVNIKNQKGIPPIHLALILEDEEIAKLLLSRGDIQIDLQDNPKYTPLHWAVFNNYKDIVRLLLEKGANVNIKNNLGNTALDLADRDMKKFITDQVKARTK